MSSPSRKMVATVLATGMYGVGHIYLGAARRGIAIMSIGAGLLLITIPGFFAAEYAVDIGFDRAAGVVLVMAAAGLACIGFWVWQLFDARKLAKQIAA